MGGVQKRRTLIVSKLESFYGTSSNNGLAPATGTFILPFYNHQKAFYIPRHMLS